MPQQLQSVNDKVKAQCQCPINSTVGDQDTVEDMLQRTQNQCTHKSSPADKMPPMSLQDWMLKVMHSLTKQMLTNTFSG